MPDPWPVITLWVVSRGLVTTDMPPLPVTETSVIGVFHDELAALEAIEKLDEGIGRYWDIDTCFLDEIGGGRVHGYGQETWKARLALLRTK